MKTKQLLFVLIFALGGWISNAQTPNWQWAKGAGGTFTDIGYGISTDAGGNVLVTGFFYGPSISFGTTTLTNADTSGITSDIFVVKYDANGNVLWAKSAGGTYGDYGISISTDAGGNVLVTGPFESSSISFGTTTLTNAGAGASDIFVVKYDANGNILWAKSAGGTFSDGGDGISTDAGGNVLVTGDFYSPSISFGTTTLTNADTSGNTPDIFVVKYDANGNVIWAKSAGGTSYDWGNGISTDAGGNVLVTGYFISPSISFGTTTLTSAGNADIFVVKYDANGNVLWAKSAGGTFEDVGYGMSTDAGGNVLVTGYFASTSISFGTTTLTNAMTNSTNDIFVVKYDANGNVLWAKSAGGTSHDIAYGISTDAGGNVLLTGDFYSPSISFGTTTLTSAGPGVSDVFVVKYDANGNVLWAKSAGGISTDIGYGISTDASGNVLVTGYFNSPSISFGTTTLTNSGGADVFVVKLGSVTTGVEENALENTISVYPNPFSTQTTLQTDILLKNATLTVYNLYGQTAKQIKNISGQTVSLSRDNLPSGLYYLRLTQDNRVIKVDKFVITD